MSASLESIGQRSPNNDNNFEFHEFGELGNYPNCNGRADRGHYIVVNENKATTEKLNKLTEADKGTKPDKCSGQCVVCDNLGTPGKKELDA